MKGKKQAEGAFFPQLFLFSLLTYGCWKTRVFWGTPYAYIPAILAFFALGCSFSVIGGFISFLYNALLRREAFRSSGQKGTAAFATAKDLNRNGLYKTNGIFLGTDLRGHPLFFEGETHGLTLSPAGGGKTICMAIPALCHLSLPMICTDLKATLACTTKDLREKRHKQKTYCVNPAHLFESILGKPARYNPVQILRDDWFEETKHKDLISDAQAMALQLYPDPPTKGENQYWRSGSRKLLVFGLVYLVTQNEGTKANLSELLRLLRNPDEFLEACYIASVSDILGGEFKDMAMDLIKKLEADDKRQIESFLEGAIQSMEIFGASSYLAESTSTCDFRFKDLKEEAATIYLIADPTKMKVFAPWLGLMGWAAITELTRCHNNKEVFFLFDEASNFKVENLPNALTGLREYGCRVWFIVQELEEIARVYGREALETIMSQTEVKQIFGIQNQKSSELFSRMCGEETVASSNYNLGHDFTDDVQKSVSESARRLMTADEIRRFPHSLLFIGKMPPIKARQVSYAEVKTWSKWIGRNPLHSKKLKSKTNIWLSY